MVHSDKEIQALLPKKKPYKYSLGDGLYVYVRPEGSKYWRLKYRFQRRERTYSIGVFPDISVKEAIYACHQAKNLLRDGIDPTHARREKNKLKEKSPSKNLFRFELSTTGGLTLETETKLVNLTPSQTEALRSFLFAKSNKDT